MTQTHEPNVKVRPGICLPYSTDTHRVPAGNIPVEPWLRAIRLVKDYNRLRRCRRTPELLGFRNIASHGFLDLFCAGDVFSVLEAEGDDCRVAVEHGDAGTRCADGEGGLFLECGGVAVEAAQDFLCFGLKFVFFACDVGHDVVEHVHAGDARVSCTGDGLEGDDLGVLDGSEPCLDRGKGDYEPDYGAVGVADEKPFFQVVVFALVRDQIEVVDIDGGNHQRDHRISSVVFGVGKHGDFSFQKLHL